MKKKMTLKEIDKLVKRKDQFTEEEKTRLADAILSNKKAREIAIKGALISGNNSLAFYLSIYGREKNIKIKYPQP